MAGTKNVLLPYQFASSVALTQAGYTFPPTNVQNLDNIAVQLNASAGLTGTFQVQASLDYSPTLGTGNWTQVATSSALTGAQTVYFDLNQLSAPWVRVVYVGQSGDAGTASGFIAAKQV